MLSPVNFWQHKKLQVLKVVALNRIYTASKNLCTCVSFSTKDACRLFRPKENKSQGRQAHCGVAHVKSCLIVILTILLNCFVAAQKKDALPLQDSLRVYKKIKHFAVRYRLTRMAYEAVFRYPEAAKESASTSNIAPMLTNPYLLYQGLVIASLEIKVLDPFGYSLNDTVQHKINAVQSVGNRLHLSTRQFIITNRLLFKVFDRVDPLRFTESERLLRSAVFIGDARITMRRKGNSDSVIVKVLVQDKWPLTLPAEVTDVNATVQFRNINLFGSGQQFEQYTKFFRDRTYLFRGQYNISNISNTYISSQVGYNNTSEETGIYLQLDKPFYSFLASWAGGLNLNHSWRKYNYNDTLTGRAKSSPLNRGAMDVWLGKSLKLGDRPGFLNQSTNLLLGLRFTDQLYLKRPTRQWDTAGSYLNSSAFIGNMGIAVQQYYKDKYIYRFGATEDVPEGLLIQFTYGFLMRERNKMRYYNGLEIARAKHFSFGYLSATFSYGIFYNSGVPNDVTTNYNLQYFTDVIRRHKLLFRQFLQLSFIHGENKIEKQTISLKPQDLYGFQNGSLTGNSRIVFNSETVCYLPYKFIGFRFAPVLLAGLGIIGDKQSRLFGSRLYQGYALGILLRNENLLTSTFQFSFGFYPFLPDHAGSILVYNPVTSFTLRVRSFSVARPEFIAY